MIKDGGSYLIDKDGNEVLVHRTAPPEALVETKDVANTDAAPYYDTVTDTAETTGGNDA